ncbi:MAG TPA: aspartate--tRNA(Asn) ligase [Candidatus Paceibacterota bacterium]
MTERTLIKNLQGHIGQSVSISGWVSVRRDHGKLLFLDIRDRSGTVQVVITPKSAGAMLVAEKLRAQWVVSVEGEVKERPNDMKTESQTGGIEISASAIAVLSEAHELPFELDTDVNIDTHFDNAPLTLRGERGRDIFSVQASVVDAYRNALRTQDFTEYQSPVLVGGDAEGGSAVFTVDYYYGQKAFLATSPQLYKQIMVGPFERVFTIAKVFRAEKHATTRHLSEVVQMDFEMGFIESHRDVMSVLEKTVRDVVRTVGEKHAGVLQRFNTTSALIPDVFPILTLREAQGILGAPDAPDLEPEQERAICEWAKEKHQSDFVFITHFPTVKRAFYTYEDPLEAPYSRGFDLLFRGLEINSGSQRIHNHEALLARMHERGLDPKKFSFYLQAFKYGMPPHGGSSTGLERFTARLLELKNVKEASAFPRDMTRIDVKLFE